MEHHEDFAVYQQHLWSNADLRTTAELIQKFDFNLLLHSDVNVRKLSLLMFALLISRPRLKLLMTENSTPKPSGKKPYRQSLFVPLVIRDSIAILSLEGNCEENYKLQKEVSKSLKAFGMNFLDRYLLVSASRRDHEARQLLGLIDLKRLSPTSNLKTISRELPDPKEATLLIKVESCWHKVADIEFSSVGGGEEEVPTITSSSNSSRRPSIFSKDGKESLISNDLKQPMGGLDQKNRQVNSHSEPEIGGDVRSPLKKGTIFILRNKLDQKIPFNNMTGSRFPASIGKFKLKSVPPHHFQACTLGKEVVESSSIIKPRLEPTSSTSPPMTQNSKKFKITAYKASPDLAGHKAINLKSVNRSSSIIKQTSQQQGSKTERSGISGLSKESLTSRHRLVSLNHHHQYNQKTVLLQNKLRR